MSLLNPMAGSKTPLGVPGLKSFTKPCEKIPAVWEGHWSHFTELGVDCEPGGWGSNSINEAVGRRRGGCSISSSPNPLAGCSVAIPKSTFEFVFRIHVQIFERCWLQYCNFWTLLVAGSTRPSPSCYGCSSAQTFFCFFIPSPNWLRSVRHC